MRSNYNKNIVLQNNFSKKKGATSFAPHIIESKFPTGNTQAELSTQIRLFNLGIQQHTLLPYGTWKGMPQGKYTIKKRGPEFQWNPRPLYIYSNY